MDSRLSFVVEAYVCSRVAHILKLAHRTSRRDCRTKLFRGKKYRAFPASWHFEPLLKNNIVRPCLEGHTYPFWGVPIFKTLFNYPSHKTRYQKKGSGMTLYPKGSKLPLW